MEIYNCLFIVDSRDDFSAKDKHITYSNGKFTIKENYAICASFLKNAQGPIFLNRPSEYLEKKEYTVLDTSKNTYVLVEGLESSPFLFAIITPKSHEIPYYIIGIALIIVGILGILYFLFMKCNSKIDKLFKVLGIIISIILLGIGVVCIIV